VEVLPQPGEFSAQNNRQDVYIDVIDSKEKILLLALTPHPDIKAIRTILEKNQNYEVDVNILTGASVAENPQPAANKVYDLIILHQLPDNSGLSNPILQRLLAKNTPVLFVMGAQSATASLNVFNPVLQITGTPLQT